MHGLTRLLLLSNSQFDELVLALDGGALFKVKNVVKAEHVVLIFLLAIAIFVD